MDTSTQEQRAAMRIVADLPENYEAAIRILRLAEALLTLSAAQSERSVSELRSVRSVSA